MKMEGGDTGAREVQRGWRWNWANESAEEVTGGQITANNHLNFSDNCF